MTTHPTTLRIAALVFAAGVALAAPAQAQSEVSKMSIALPVASVVASHGPSRVAGAVVAIPAVLSVAGTVLVVKTVESTARGTAYLLERASDGAQASVEIAGRGAGAVSLAAGSALTVSVVGAGVILSAAGEAICFVPNALGRALLHNQRLI